MSGTNNIFRRAADLQDLSRLSEDLLTRLAETAGALSGTVWVLDQDQAFRQVASRGRTGQRTRSIDPGEIIHRHEEISRGIPFFEQKGGKVVLNSLFLPVLHNDVLVALVHLETRSHGENGIGDETIEGMRNTGEEYAAFLHNAQMLDRIRKNPLKDLESDTYNEPFFLDFLGRQVTMSRRFRRRIGVVNLEYEGAERFQKNQSYKLVQALTRDISETLRGILRDYDVVAHVGNLRFFVGLPETDSLGCRIAIERIRRGFTRLAYLEERFERYGLIPHFGFSCFPEDGSSEDALIMKALKKTRSGRTDPFNTIQWGDRGFWDLVEVFTTDTGVLEVSALDCTEPTSFKANFTYLLQEAVINDILLNPEQRGLLYIGTDNVYITEALITKNTALSRAATRISVFGDLTGAQALREWNINTITLSPEQSKGFQFILLLTDKVTYALAGVHYRAEEWKGFHTSNERLVERMVFKLREEYSLQEQI